MRNIDWDLIGINWDLIGKVVVVADRWNEEFEGLVVGIDESGYIVMSPRPIRNSWDKSVLWKSDTLFIKVKDKDRMKSVLENNISDIIDTDLFPEDYKWVYEYSFDVEAIANKLIGTVLDKKFVVVGYNKYVGAIIINADITDTTNCWKKIDKEDIINSSFLQHEYFTYISVKELIKLIVKDIPSQDKEDTGLVDGLDNRDTYIYADKEEEEKPIPTHMFTNEEYLDNNMMDEDGYSYEDYKLILDEENTEQTKMYDYYKELMLYALSRDSFEELSYLSKAIGIFKAVKE